MQSLLDAFIQRGLDGGWEAGEGGCGAAQSVGLGQAPAAFEGAIGLLRIEQVQRGAVQERRVVGGVGGQSEDGVGGHDGFGGLAGQVGGEAAVVVGQRGEVGAAAGEGRRVTGGVDGVEGFEDGAGALGVALGDAVGEGPAAVGVLVGGEEVADAQQQLVVAGEGGAGQG